MNEVISKIIKITSPNMPPNVDFIEGEIIKNNIEPLRWAIIDIEQNNLTLSVSGRTLN
ncbi:hypothetical protein IJ425_06115 [bacterium]|nr:hypothetical protein [bacterium]